MARLDKRFNLKCSASRFALTIAVSTAVITTVVLSGAMSKEITYTGASSQLHQDPTGNSSTYNSLFGYDSETGQNIYTGNIITIKPADSADLTTTAGRQDWNTVGTTSPVAPYVIYGGFSVGAAGSGITNGGSGQDIKNNTIDMKHVQYDWTGKKAPNGVGGGYGGGGGVGGMGGGSVYGGMSIGGSGPNTAAGGAGGMGGNVTSNTVELTNAVLLGAHGGSGGNGDFSGSGVGGMGGGSVYGGMSIGGSGGDGDGFVGSGSGGDGGNVTSNTVTLTNVQLTGGSGGMGGSSAGSNFNVGSGGVGGMGGGSVYGGMSIGGSGGYGYGNGKGHGGLGGVGGNVTSNTVTLTNVQLTGGSGGDGGRASDYGGSGVGGMGGGSVYGGMSIGGSGGMGGVGGVGGNVTSNTVTLTNVQLTGGSGGDGGRAGKNGGSGVGGMGGGSVYGGMSIGGSSGFRGGDVGGMGGNGGDVTRNTITLTNVQLTGGSGGDGGSVYGGMSIGGSGGYGGDVTRNTINISGKSLIWGDIYGGYSHGGAKGTDYGAADGIGGSATGNIVTLEGGDITIGHKDDQGVMQYGSIYGGYSVDGAGVSAPKIFDKVIKGNTLNLVGYRGTVKAIYNFETYNWTLPSDVKDGDKLVTIADGGTAVDLTATVHTVSMYNDGSRLNDGDSVTMIDKTKDETYQSTSHIIKQGQFIVYNATLSQTKAADNANAAFVLTIGDKPDTKPAPTEPETPAPTEPEAPAPTKPETTAPTEPETPAPTEPETPAPAEPETPSTGGQSAARVNPQSKSYSEGRAASLGFVNQGNDLISTNLSGLRAHASNQAAGNNTPIMPFMIMNGSSQRISTGSHVDIKGFNMALGIATGFDFNGGSTATIGAFFEYGRGTYDTYNSFSNFASVYGDGDGEYKGGGFFGRIDFAGTGLGHVSKLSADQADGVYLEASIKAGRISNSFDVGGNMTALGKLEGDYRGSYDSDSTYYGGHLAGGYVFNFDEKQSLDVFGRYLWTHMDGDNVTIGYEQLHFDSATSSRLQVGGRYAYAYSEQLKPYIGATYEHEFNGEVKANAYEFNLDRPSLEGSTGIFEAGFNFQPIATNKALSIDVNGQGYVGQRQGGGGGVKIKYQF